MHSDCGGRRLCFAAGDSNVHTSQSNSEDRGGDGSYMPHKTEQGTAASLYYCSVFMRGAVGPSPLSLPLPSPHLNHRCERRRRLKQDRHKGAYSREAAAAAAAGRSPPPPSPPPGRCAIFGGRRGGPSAPAPVGCARLVAADGPPHQVRTPPAGTR